MRLITLLFVALLALIQYPLWIGRGGWLRVHELDRQIQAQQATNNALKARNDKLAAEVKDLREGAGAVEERARYELGMIKDQEIFVQIVDPAHTPVAPSASALPVPLADTGTAPSGAITNPKAAIAAKSNVAAAASAAAPRR